MIGYLGTYASPESLGLYRFTLNEATGALGPATLFLHAPEAKCVAVRKGLVAATVRRGEQAGVLVADAQGCVLDELLPEDVPSCYVSWHGARLLTANYHEGTVLIYRWEGRLTLEHRLVIAPSAGCHQALVWGSTLLVPCLELDVVRRFQLDRDLAPLPDLPFPSGSGPRHGLFRGEQLYLVSERSNQLFSIPGGVRPITNSGATAAVRLAPDGRFLYVSTRGADMLTVFRLEGEQPVLIQQTGCGGQHPRDFVITPDGRFLLVVNRLSNNVVSFSLDPRTGLIGRICGQTEVHEGVGIALEERTEHNV